VSALTVRAEQVLLHLCSKMVEEDKAQHIICAFMAMIAVQFVLGSYTAAIVIFVFGLIKELWDLWKGTGFCWYDVTANILGISFTLFWLALSL